MIRLSRWATLPLRWLASPGEADDVIGDLEEAHGRRLRRYGVAKARMLTAFEIMEMSAAIVRVRGARARVRVMEMLQDYKLGLRMLLKYPGLTIAGGLALAIAIGVGAGWYDVMGDFWRPAISLPDGDRLVQIQMRNLSAGGDERRVLHDFGTWQRDVRSVTELGAYRTVERNLTLGDARPEPVTIAEITPSAFQLVRVPPLLGRPLVDADQTPGATPVVVIGYHVWRQQFAARSDAVGRTVKIGETVTTVVGVMPDGFAFPVNHTLWMPLQLRTAGYAPLEGPSVDIFGRLAQGSTQAQANAELTAVAERAATDSPRTHEHLRPRVLAYGGESPGDRSVLELAITHLPVLVVLVIACMNVGTLVYARTATREAEIATRYSLGAGRARIVGQLFVEALVLASAAAVLGLTVADRAIRWGMNAFYAGLSGGPPFWVNPGLKPTTVFFAGALTVAGAAILGVLPALRVTSSHVHMQLRTLGVGGSTLRFGWFWTAAMITQVTLTVILIPPALGISEEAVRDRRIRSQFPAEEYLAVRLELDLNAANAVGTSTATPGRPLTAIYSELERRLAQEAGVRSVTFGDRLPGMSPDVRRGEAETSPDAAPVLISNLWMASVGPGYFESFDIPLVAGRHFTDNDRTDGARVVMVNEAYARRYLQGASPVGRRVRFADRGPLDSEPWFEIVGMVRDVGMTPTDLGEAPYVFTPASAAATTPMVVGVRMGGDPSALAPRVRAIAADLDAGLRLDDVRALDEIVWNEDIPMVVGAAGIVVVVSLGLFLSAAGIFSLMAVSVARRTREIGLRTALGATRGRVLAGVFSHALTLIGSGIAAGNGVLLLFASLSDEIEVADLAFGLMLTSTVMLTVGLLACVEPARRALRIQPTDALKEA